MADARNLEGGGGQGLDGLLDAIVVSLQRGEDVSLVGSAPSPCGPRARAGATQTGDINIEASRVPSFKAGKALKDAVN